MKIKNKKIDRAWIHDHINDPYVKLAQAEGYRARAAYKIKEIDEKFGLFKSGQLVLDLGAAPGAWSQYTHRRFLALRKEPRKNKSGADTDMAAKAAQDTIIALDLLKFEPIEGVHFIQGDFREDSVVDQLRSQVGERSVDVIISDMAPNLSGIESADAARMSDLVELALEFAKNVLNSEGVLVCKVFHGSGYSQLVENFKQIFCKVKAHKPKASRDKSAETFLIGQGLKNYKG
jgi:23S rRNA (uridine2552-2'-O)-methyltransferase